MKTPLFSIVIPLFNHEKYIGDALQSVLSQSVIDWELIVVDDGSTDRSRQVVESFCDSRIHYHYQDNRGAADAINQGISTANGKYVAILNSDDTFHPERLAFAMEVLESNPSVSAFFSAYSYINKSSEIIRESKEIFSDLNLPSFSASISDESISKESDNWVLTLLTGNVLHTTSNLIARSDLFVRVGLFQPWHYVHDYEFFLRLSAMERIYFDSRALLNYRFHETNTLSENAVRSVYETNLVIAQFLANWRPREILQKPNKNYKWIDFLSHKLKLYGGERFLLSLLILQILARNQSVQEKVALVDLMLDESLFRTIAQNLSSKIEFDQLQQKYQWQKTQTNQWWQESQKLLQELDQQKEHLAWQKTQTNQWWQESQKLLQELDQQKEHLAWQKTQTNQWWQESQKLLQELDQQKEHGRQETQSLKLELINTNSFLGIPNVLRNCRRRVISIFNKENE